MTIDKEMIRVLEILREYIPDASIVKAKKTNMGSLMVVIEGKSLSPKRRITCDVDLITKEVREKVYDWWNDEEIWVKLRKKESTNHD